MIKKKIRKPRDIKYKGYVFNIDEINKDYFIGINLRYNTTYYSIGVIRKLSEMLSKYDKWRERK